MIPVTPVKSKIADSSEKAASLQLEVVSLREENAKLSRSLAEQRKAFEDRQSNTDGAALNELKEKLEPAEEGLLAAGQRREQDRAGAGGHGGLSGSAG